MLVVAVDIAVVAVPAVAVAAVVDNSFPVPFSHLLNLYSSMSFSSMAIPSMVW